LQKCEAFFLLIYLLFLICKYFYLFAIGQFRLCYCLFINAGFILSKIQTYLSIFLETD